MTTHHKRSPGDPKLVDTLLNDFHQPDFKKRVGRDYKDLQEFMLDEGQKKRLAGMGSLKRIFYLMWWFFKGLLLRLSSARRLMLAVGLILILASRSSADSAGNLHIVGGLLLLFVLMLELKDKMLAREELEAGRSVQEALMPDRSPEVPGWRVWLFTRPANDVGGDMIDFFRLDGERFNVSIGDVAGKGLSAALLTTKLQASIRALLPAENGLDALAAKLNRIFCRDSIPSMFASVMCLEISPESHKIRGVNAGHLPPIIFSSSGASSGEKGGPALGLMVGASYSEFDIILQPGETLIAYSDGLTEARSMDGSFFGEQRLLNLLPRLASQPIDRIGENLLVEIDSFRADAPVHDDITLILLRKL